jgi:hypothetical protein
MKPSNQWVDQSPPDSIAVGLSGLMSGAGSAKAISSVVRFACWSPPETSAGSVTRPIGLRMSLKSTTPMPDCYEPWTRT